MLGYPVRLDPPAPLSLQERFDEVQKQWRAYVADLESRYPPPPGTPFLFKCPHHHRINELLK